MKFRTEIEIEPFARKIDHTRRGFSVGSCFADRMAEKLARVKFPVVSNPSGVLYNPLSVAQGIETAGGAHVAAADWVLVTFGTAWVWELDGKVVANCGRRPAHLFTRRRLTVDEIVERFGQLMSVGKGDGRTPGDEGAGALAGKQVIFTVSPVRHLKDGFEENSLSKSILRLAVEEIVGRFPDSQYFPAYEILCDDLRDYRFYGKDLVHPSDEAVEYIWEKFSAAAFDDGTANLTARIEEIVRATEHRPFDASSEAHAAFRRSMSARTEELALGHPEIDLSRELEFFGGRD